MLPVLWVTTALSLTMKLIPIWPCITGADVVTPGAFYQPLQRSAGKQRPSPQAVGIRALRTAQGTKHAIICPTFNCLSTVALAHWAGVSEMSVSLEHLNTWSRLVAVRED